MVGEKSTPTGTNVAPSIGPDGWTVTVEDPTGRLDPPDDDPPPLLPVPGKDGRNGGDVVVGVTGRSGTVVAGTVVDGSGGSVVVGAGAVVVGAVVGAVGGGVVGGVTSVITRANT